MKHLHQQRQQWIPNFNLASSGLRIFYLLSNICSSTFPAIQSSIGNTKKIVELCVCEPPLLLSNIRSLPPPSEDSYSLKGFQHHIEATSGVSEVPLRHFDQRRQQQNSTCSPSPDTSPARDLGAHHAVVLRHLPTPTASKAEALMPMHGDSSEAESYSGPNSNVDVTKNSSGIIPVCTTCLLNVTRRV